MNIKTVLLLFFLKIVSINSVVLAHNIHSLDIDWIDNNKTDQKVKDLKFDFKIKIKFTQEELIPQNLKNNNLNAVLISKDSNFITPVELSYENKKWLGKSRVPHSGTYMLWVSGVSLTEGLEFVKSHKYKGILSQSDHYEKVIVEQNNYSVLFDNRRLNINLTYKDEKCVSDCRLRFKVTADNRSLSLDDSFWKMRWLSFVTDMRGVEALHSLLEVNSKDSEFIIKLPHGFLGAIPHRIFIYSQDDKIKNQIYFVLNKKELSIID